jgi:elongator complex protein 2
MCIYDEHIVISTAFHGLHALLLVSSELKLETSLFPDVRCTAMAISKFADSVPVLAFGNSNGSVQICSPETGAVITLEGSAWVLSLKFSLTSTSELLLAAASQDRTVRIWRIASAVSRSAALGVDLQTSVNLDQFAVDVDLMGCLSGHSDWVTCVDFAGSSQLISASFDGQVLLWNGENSDYDISVRLGTTAVSDDQSGFCGCRLLKKDDVLAVSRNGSFSRWTDGRNIRCVSGHTDCVADVTWTPLFRSFISVGLDNVARFYAFNETAYQEYARPLIHGYSLLGVAMISDDSYAFVGDEKCVRILQPTQCLASTLNVLRNSKLPFASMVAALSLDNKALMTPDDVEAPLTPSDFSKENKGSHDMWLTRWPEIRSLWGHERELTKITVAGDWMASGDSRGAVAVWDLKTLEKRGYLRDCCRKSAVTGLCGSPDGSLLLAVIEIGCVKLIDPVTVVVVRQFDVQVQARAGSWAWNSEYFAIGVEQGLIVYERDGEVAGRSDGTGVSALEYVGDYDIVIGYEDGGMKQLHYDASERKFTNGRVFQGHGGRVNAIRLNRSTGEVVSTGVDHVVLVHPAE